MRTTSWLIRRQQLELPPCIHQKDGCGAIEKSTLPQCPCWTDLGNTQENVGRSLKTVNLGTARAQSESEGPSNGFNPVESSATQTNLMLTPENSNLIRPMLNEK